MARPTASPHGKKTKISVALPPELFEWLSAEVEARRFASMSHGIEVALLALKGKEAPGRTSRTAKPEK